MRLIDADALIPMMKYATTDSEIGVFPIKIGFDDIKKVINEQATFEPEQRWIPCSERLPEEGRYFVARHDDVSKTNFTDILWFEKNVWWNRKFTGNFAVFAWMPLPEPYKEGQDD